MLDLRRNLTYFNSAIEDDVDLTEFISSRDPRASLKEMTDARRQEIKNLPYLATLKVVLQVELAPDAKLLPG